METKRLKLKKKERKRLEKLAWKKARQSKAAPFDVLLSLENALLWLEDYRSFSKRSRTASK
ncbi:Uncharacterised protein [Kingella potus]|uniref:Uncharacterized protein n=1 Tax=Kingella potus TaxID=265175 RepID=A0A377R3H1_9NEIS|nr:hypothetical protein [Kingella potus]UOP00554.1 hypothetical protein LVJ84_12050 [Kingella potus]UOP01992.1 hypothetical protein LVJ84_14555 [Kingella potus]STQ99824.1 Uncharacterised protein [Kingella potus]STR03057.1 Uncharacterised protein [Kingella potus]STR03430.1 Uncharacterised protein [Kingella potus]